MRSEGWYGGAVCTGAHCRVSCLHSQANSYSRDGGAPGTSSSDVPTASIKRVYRRLTGDSGDRNSSNGGHVTACLSPAGRHNWHYVNNSVLHSTGVMCYQNLTQPMDGFILQGKQLLIMTGTCTISYFAFLPFLRNRVILA
jgi:hypothetical protein